MVFIPDGNGNYPLHIAIQNHQSYDVIYQLFKVSTDIGRIHDVKTSLLPFMLAAEGNWESEKEQISTVYKLLREEPHLLFAP